MGQSWQSDINKGGIDMLKKNKIIAIILIISLVIFPVNMPAVCAEDTIIGPSTRLQTGCFYYRIEGNEIIITGYNRKSKDRYPVIPSFVDGKPVVAIASNALKNFRGYELTIPITIKSIRDGVFDENTYRDILQINYMGSEEQWKSISIGKDNNALNKLLVVCSDSKTKIDFKRTEKYDSANHSITDYGVYVVKKNHTLWENPTASTRLKKTPKKIVSGVKDAAIAFYGVYALKTNDTLWHYFPDYNSRKIKYKAKKIMKDVKELPQEMSGSADDFYIIKKNGQLWHIKIKYDKYSSPKGYATKKVASNVRHVYCTEYENPDKDSRSEENIYFLKKDGSLWGWGQNANGELGIGNTKKQKKPRRIMNDVQKICCVENDISAEPVGITVYAIKADGTLYAWGANPYSTIPTKANTRGGKQLGKKVKKPVKVMEWVSNVSANDFYCAILRKDDTLWTMRGGESLKKVDDDVLYMNMDFFYLNYIKKNYELWYYRNPGIRINGGVGSKEGNGKVLDGVCYVKGDYAVKKDGSLWTWKIKSIYSNEVKSRKKIMGGIKLPKQVY